MECDPQTYGGWLYYTGKSGINLQGFPSISYGSLLGEGWNCANDPSSYQYKRDYVNTWDALNGGDGQSFTTVYGPSFQMDACGGLDFDACRSLPDFYQGETFIRGSQGIKLTSDGDYGSSLALPVVNATQSTIESFFPFAAAAIGLILVFWVIKSISNLFREDLEKWKKTLKDIEGIEERAERERKRSQKWD